jgi:L-rhamnose mutarotase
MNSTIMKQFVLALDLKNDPHLIAEYEAHHRAVWPEIIQSIRASGILDCSIYRIENRLTMILKTTDEFDFSLKAIDDLNNPKVQEWETLMWKYQQALPTARPGEKWILMKSIFQLSQI